MAATKKTTQTRKAVKKAATGIDAAKATKRKPVARKRAPPPADVAGDPPADGAALVERVTRAVERELAEIESIVGGMRGKARPTDADRRARTLASLARTLGEVRRLRAADETRKPDDEPSAARDLEEFRKVLFKRLEGMPGRPATLPDAEDERGGDA